MTPRGALGAIGCAILMFFGVLTLISMLMLLWPTKAHGQTYRWPDRAQLTALADSAHIDRRAVLAIAWEETATNLDPLVRGHHCWYTVPAHWEHWTVSRLFSLQDSTLVPRHAHHERNCEVGRMQIKPSTARLRCPSLDIFTYEGNLACFAKMFTEDVEIGSPLSAIRHHNGSGVQADAYVQRVLRTVGWLAITEGS